MQLDDILSQTGGLQSIARELGISESQAASAATALLPAIMGGFKKQAQQQPEGVQGLGGLLGRLGGVGLLENVLGAQPTDVSRGNQVLGQIFGSKDVSRAVAQNAAGSAGLDPSVVQRMLPMLAMLVAGYLSSQRGGGAAAPGAGAGTPTGAASGGGLGGMLGGLLQGRGGGSRQGLAAMLDLNGDGNPLDDILRMVGKPPR